MGKEKNFKDKKNTQGFDKNPSLGLWSCKISLEPSEYFPLLHEGGPVLWFTIPLGCPDQ
jgi:hypothetical protein